MSKNAKIEHKFPEFQYANYVHVAVDEEGYEQYYDDKTDAASEAEDHIVATYKLVKVERLKVVKSLKLVKA